MFNCLSAISCAAPPASFNLPSKFETSSAVSESIVPTVAPLFPNNSSEAAFLSVAELICNIASSNDIPLFDNSRNIFLNPVPAVEASNPLSVKVPNKAVVFSTDNPAVFATGATELIAVANFSISKEDEENDLAITSTTLCVSEASNPKPLKVAPVTSAARGNSVPVAAASCKVASVIA